MAHLIFVTKYRRPILTGPHFDLLAQVYREICEKRKCRLVEFSGKADHVHLLVRYPPPVALGALVRDLKANSSRLLRCSDPALIRRRHIWSPSYFATSVGGAPLDVIKAYVEGQNRPQ